MKKSILGVSTLVVLVAAVSVWYYFNFSWDLANANPDYICVKPVTIDSCESVVWWEWQEDGTRTWTWIKALEVWYYQTRTSCEAGYSAKVTWSTAAASTAANYMINNWEGDELYSDYTAWSSWRHSSDFTYSSTGCILTEVDDIAPVWAFR
jgi:hypothetical protein